MYFYLKVDVGRRLVEKRVKEVREVVCLNWKYIYWFIIDVGFIGIKNLVIEETN